MTPMRIRISTELSKQLTATLRQAYRAGDLRLVRRVTALLVEGVARQCRVSPRRWG